jgi:ssDNA-binding Zn-finger/Zn-ribbon topoisomerase 1
MKNAMELKIKGIKCDNKSCDYRNENVDFEEYENWLNKPCPKCGANLLTQKDLDNTKALANLTNIINAILPKSEAEGDGEKIILNVEMDGTGNMNFKLKENKEPKYFQDCNNCPFVSNIDGVCDWDMNPNYEEGDPLYCEKEAKQ